MINRAVGDDTLALLKEVETIISPVYLVGGSVRDTLLGKKPHDYDFCTPHHPDVIEEAIRTSGKRAFTVGKKFGTLGCKVGEHFIEITTFRTEIYEETSRKPHVEFIDDITHDLSRRDFTINAMAIRADGTLIDPFGGLSDLEQGILRTVNKLYDRYNEDPLRMLRAARFCAELGFAVERETRLQAGKKADKILEVSRERWTVELDKLLVSKQPTRGLHFLAHTRLLAFMLPELGIQVGFNQNSPYHQLDLWSHTIRTVELSPADVTVRWGALLHDIGKPYVQIHNNRGYSNYQHHAEVGAEMTLRIGAYLRWSNKRIAEVTNLVRHHLDDDDSPIGLADSTARYRP